jgi:ATP-dependent 26S proteasome regulatory subunit
MECHLHVTHQCLGVGVLNKEIEHMVLLALKSPEIYDDVAQGQDASLSQINPIPFPFLGMVGTGKTSCARVIASQAVRRTISVG